MGSISVNTIKRLQRGQLLCEAANMLTMTMLMFSASVLIISAFTTFWGFACQQRINAGNRQLTQMNPLNDWLMSAIKVLAHNLYKSLMIQSITEWSCDNDQLLSIRGKSWREGCCYLRSHLFFFVLLLDFVLTCTLRAPSLPADLWLCASVK